MRPAEISNESIIEAGQALQAASRNITGFALRKEVGGGNPSRLIQVWREHVSSQTEAQAEPVAELPHEVAEEMAGVAKDLNGRLSALAVELNDKAVKAAERRVAEVIRTAGEQREQAERELADAAQTVEDLENTLEAAQEAGKALETKLADLQTVHQAQAVELAQVKQTSKHAAEQHAAEVHRLNASTEAERQRHHVALSDLDQVRAELATVTAQAKAAEQTHQEHRQTAAKEAHRVAERMTRAEAERDAARKEAAQAREDAAKLRGQAEALQTQAGELTRALAIVQKAGGAA